MEEKMMDFADYLSHHRILNGHSYRMLDSLTGISYSWIRKIETRTKPPLNREYWPVLLQAMPTMSAQGLALADALSRNEIRFPFDALSPASMLKLIELLNDSEINWSRVDPNTLERLVRDS
jgi:hypothetical protein